MSRFRMYPTAAQAEQMLLHCAHARYVWNLAVEQHAHRKPGRRPAPGSPSSAVSSPRPGGERLAAGRERGRATAGAAGLRQSQSRPVRFRVR
ncbi:helix-turn-helix domain-containing protein [Streptomyces sp. INA 01156]